MSEVSKSEFADWKNSSTTQEVFLKIKEVQEQNKEHMFYGGTLTDATERDTARTVGIIQGLDMLLEMDWE